MEHGQDDSLVEQRPPIRRQVRAFALRAIRRFVGNRSTLFWAIGAPVAYYLFFGVYVSTGGDNPGAIRAGMAPAFGIFGALAATMMTFSGNLGADLRAKRYRKLRSLPISPGADLAGRFLAGLLFGFLAFAAVMLVGLFTGATIRIPGPVPALAVLVSVFLLCLFGLSLGVLSAAIVQNGQRLQIVGNGGLLVLFFGTGYNGINPDILPEIVVPVVNFLPNSLATRITVATLSPPAASSQSSLVPPAVPTGLFAYVLLIGYAVVLSGLAALAMDRYIYRGEVEE